MSGYNIILEDPTCDTWSVDDRHNTLLPLINSFHWFPPFVRSRLRTMSIPWGRASLKGCCEKSVYENNVAFKRAIYSTAMPHFSYVAVQSFPLATGDLQRSAPNRMVQFDMIFDPGPNHDQTLLELRLSNEIFPTEGPAPASIHFPLDLENVLLWSQRVFAWADPLDDTLDRGARSRSVSRMRRTFRAIRASQLIICNGLPYVAAINRHRDMPYGYVSLDPESPDNDSAE